jgi:hypothetical protein
MRVCALSLITNRAGARDDSHARILNEGKQAEGRISLVLENLLATL